MSELRGIARWPDGAPAGGALVSVGRTDRLLRRVSRLTERSRADGAGRFRWSPVAAGAWSIEAELGDARSPVAVVDVGEGGVVEVELVLDQALFELRFVDDASLPIVGVDVRARSSTRSGSLREHGVSDEEGRVLLSRFESGESLALVCEHRDFVRAAVDLVVEPRPAVIRLERAWALEGRVVDALTARPVERFSLEVTVTDDGDRSSTRKRGFLAPDGRFRFEGFSAGDASVEVVADGYFRLGPEAVSVGPGVAPAHLAVRPSAWLTARVVDSAQRPLVGIFARLLPSVQAGEDPALRPRRSRTRDDGVFRIRELEPGEYRLVIGADDEPLFERDVHLGVGMTELAQIEIARLGSLEVRVHDAAGEPVDEADVIVEGTGLGARQIVETDEDGVCVIGSLLADDYVVSCGDEESRVTVTAAARAVAQIHLAKPPEEDSP